MKKKAKLINSMSLNIIEQGVASQLTLGYGYIKLEPRGGLLMWRVQ